MSSKEVIVSISGHISATTEAIRVVDLTTVNTTNFKGFYVGCIVLTKDNKIMLQQRPLNWRTFPDCLATFGGHIEINETPISAIVRELAEELGAKVTPAELLSLGAITEAITNYSELIYIYFWHDKHGTITGCYECEAKYYDNCMAALAHPKIMDDVRWLLEECKNRKLLT